MKNFEIKAQSNDNVVMTITAKDMFEATQQAAEYFGVEIGYTFGAYRQTFETDSDYFDLYEVEA